MRKHLLFIMFLVALLGTFTTALADITIGSGTATVNTVPLSTNWGYNYTQQIVTQAQLGAANTLVGIKFYFVSGSTASSNNWTIYLGNTTKTAFSTNTDWVPLSGLTQVYSGNLVMPTAPGWWEITFNTPFSYDGTSNLVIAIDENTRSFGSPNALWYAYTSGTNTAMWYRSDSTNPNPASPPTATSRGNSPNQVILMTPSANPPNPATNPNPADLATNIGLSTPLSWSNGGGAPTGYDVYFGTTLPAEGNPNIGHESQTSTSFNPGVLQYSTTYYWKVVPWNANGSTGYANCPTWSFTTLADPTITSFPYTEGFNNTTFPPLGWVNYQVTKSNGAVNYAQGAWTRATSGTYNSTAGAARVSYNYSALYWACLQLPPVNIPANHALSFFWKDADSKVAGQDTTYCEISTDNGASWTVLAYLSAASSQSAYQMADVSLAAYVGDGRLIRFRDGTNATNSAYGASVDEIKIAPANNPPNPAASPSPSNSATSVAINANLSWTSGGGSPTGYKLFLGTDPEALEVAYDGEANTFDPETNFQFGKTYYWKINPYNEFGNASDGAELPVWSFTTAAGTPSVTTPSNNSIANALNVILNWGDVAGATGYKVSVGTETGNYNLIDGAVVTESQYTHSSNWLFNTAYFWRVTTLNGDQEVQGTEWKFTTLTGVPSVTAPTNNATNQANTVMLNWADVADATGFKVQVGLAAGNYNIVDGAIVTQSQYTHSSSWPYSTQIFWRVTTLNGEQEVQGSEWNFTTKADPTRPMPYTETFDAGVSLPANWTSDMTILPSHGQSGNGLYKNLWSSASSCYVTTPPVGPITANTRLDFDYRYVEYTGYPSTAYVLATGDKLDVMLSTDSGLTFETLYTIDSSNHNTSNAFATCSVFLSQAKLANADDIVVVKLQATRAAGDYYLDIDNISFKHIAAEALFSINPTSKSFGTVNAGASTSQVFTVSNDGLSPLTISEVSLAGSEMFSLLDPNSYPVVLSPSQSYNFTARFSPTAVGEFTATLKVTDTQAKVLHEIPLSGTGTDAGNAGGGDTASTAGGYYFANNLSVAAPTTPSYYWLNLQTAEVSSTPTSGSLNDGYWGPIDLGFEFNYYGSPYTNCYISTNGFVSFGTGATAYTNATIPINSTPNNLIALFWDDLEYYEGFSHIYYGNYQDRFVITYKDVGRTGSAYDPQQSVTAQLVLYADGRIAMNFNDITGTAHTPTIGIENADGTKGIQYHYNGVGGPYSTDAKGGGVTIMFGENPQTLPVELTSFTATAMANSFVTISWMVASETDHLGYNILRNTANDLSNAIQINAEAISTGDQIGSQINYSYPDYEVEAGNNYYYWLQSLDMSGISTFFGPLMVSMTTGPQDPGTPAIPVVTSLNNAYPNPFNPNTTISYSMADAGNARIDIYNLRGQILRSFERDHANAGNYSFNWDGKDASGNFVGSGIYLYRMTSGNYSATKKFILSK